MIEKTVQLPCLDSIHIRRYDDNVMYYVTVTANPKRDTVGFTVAEDEKSVKFGIQKDGLPVLRDLLIELAPLPSPVTIFRENVIKIFNFLKGGKS